MRYCLTKVNINIEEKINSYLNAIMIILQRKSITKMTIWLVAEIILNIIGLDDLADYSEFVFEHVTGKQMIVAQISAQ